MATETLSQNFFLTEFLHADELGCKPVINVLETGFTKGLRNLHSLHLRYRIQHCNMIVVFSPKLK